MKKLYEKLSKFQDIKIKKDGKSHHGKYITLDHINEVLLPLLKENKLIIYHTSLNGAVETHVADIEGGEKITSSFLLIQVADMQKMGGAVSYAKRYNLGQLFNIITDEDDDGNAASGMEKDTGKKILPWIKDVEVDLTVIPQLQKEHDEGSTLEPVQVLKRLRNKWAINKKHAETITNFLNQL